MATTSISEGAHLQPGPGVCSESAAPVSERARKWGPSNLISETGGEIVFAELAARTSVRSREQAELFYGEGIRVKRLVDAVYYREVHAQHTPEEITKAETIEYSQRTIFREEKSLVEKLEREQRRESPDPFRLDSLEAHLRSLVPFIEAAREQIASATPRELELVKTLHRIKKVYRRANGWKLKAQRQIACGLYALEYLASKCGRSFFLRFRCHNRYCPVCGPHIHDELVVKYLRLDAPVKEFLVVNPLYRLRVLDITAIKRGDRMPTPEDVRQFKLDVKKLIERVNRYVAEKLRVPYSKKLTGYLYCLEFGFENGNLHCHGLLLSPYIEQGWLSAEWRKVRSDGSFRVWIAEALSFEAGLKHALEYTGKYAAPSAERAFELELAFAGCRRVDGLGWFFNRLPNEADETADLRCPCGDPECFLKPNNDLGWQPIEDFEIRGIPDLDVVRERGSPPQKEVGHQWAH